MKNHLLAAGLLLSLFGCGGTEQQPVLPEALQGYRWVSQDYNLSLVVTPTDFVFGNKQTNTSPVPYYTLPAQRIVLGRDTVVLYLKRGKELRIRPLSKDVASAESIWIAYSTVFFQIEK